MKISLFILFLVSMFLVCCQRASDNHSGWRGDNRDGVVRNFDAPAEWPAELKQVWNQNVGFCDASPVLVNNRLFLHVKQQENEVTLCLDAETGEVVWRTVNNPAPEVTGGARPHPGPRSTPFVAGGKVYTLGAGGILNCMDIQSGEVLWKNNQYSDVPEFYTGTSPLVEDDICFVHMGGRETGVVVAFNASDGEKLWELPGHPATYSSPVIMQWGKEKILVVQTETDLIGVSMGGNLLWQLPTPGEIRYYNSSTPVIDGQNIIIAGQGLGTRSFKVSKQGNEYILNENWINPEFGVSFNTPLLKDGYLYGHEGRLGKLFCLNAETGETCWADTITLNRFASILDLGNEILSLTANGKMLIYEPDPDRYIQKSSYSVTKSEIYAHPVVYRNSIYTKDKEQLIRWQVN